MHQEQFEIRYGSLWKQLEEQLVLLEEGRQKKDKADKPDLASFPLLYRQVCNHYALARSRLYGPELITMLQQLVLRGHQQLYRPGRASFQAVRSFINRDFPETLRTHWRFFWLAFALLFLPAGVVGTQAYRDQAMIYSVMDQSQVARVEYMYDPMNRKAGRTSDRTSATDVRMFGYYIYNNVSIGFRTFAGGMLLGIGTVFYLLFNGLTLGAVAGHLSHEPFAMVFWPFVAGHGAFELIAIVISGSAGLLLANAILRPGAMRRGAALKQIAPQAMTLIMGAMVLFIIAALIEAFWSPAPVSANIKFGVAAINWLLVPGYLLLAGRRNES